MQTNTHLARLIHDQAKIYGDREVLIYKDFGSKEWKSYSWNQFSQTVRVVSNALLNLGVKVQENVGVFSQNSIQYLFCDFGAWGIRAVTIPFYATSSEQQIQFMVNDAKVRFLFVGEQEQYDKARRVFSTCQTLERIIIFDKGVRISNQDANAMYFEDFLKFSELCLELPLVEMDTVIGNPGGKTIMTMHFVNADFMFGILLENKTAAEASNKITTLKKKMKAAGFSFGDIFPVILTDNGGEFSNVSAFENNADGDLETHLFFCDPNASYQKPHVEKNHTLFRDIVPKGSSFDSFTQETVDLIFSHVNAVKRKQFNGKSSYDLFTFSYSEKLASIFGISYISPEKVCQSPSLLK